MKKKRILAVLLTLCMALGTLPMTAFADEDCLKVEKDIQISGYCGGDATAEKYEYTYTDKNNDLQTKTVYKNVEWELMPNENEDTYTLKITGNGKMADWVYISGAIRTAITDCLWSAYADKIISVEMEDGITFGDRAFQGLKALKSFTFPKGITEIPPYTFADCVVLENMSIPEGITSIGLAAFRACDSMTEITFPNSVETFGNSVLIGCANIEKVTFPDGITEIPTGFFQNVTGLKEITLPTTIETIGSNAFSGCSNLQSVNLSETQIKTLSANLFTNNTSLRSIILPNGLGTIEGNALMGTGITALIIPEEVSSIGRDALKDCENLHSVVMHTAAFKDSEMNEAGGSGAYWQNIPTGIFSTIADNSVVYFVGDELPLAFTGGYVTNRINESKTAMAVTNGGIFAEGTEFIAGELKEPIKDGFAFKGWYTKDGTDDDDWGSEATTVTAGQTYYAKWEKKAESSVTITSSVDSMRGKGTVTLTVTATPENILGNVEVSCNGGIDVTKNTDGTYSAYLPNKTQTYTFTAKYAGDDNYNVSSDTCTVSVTKKSSTSSSSSSSSEKTYAVSKGGGIENGKVTIDPSKAAEGDKVTITVTPDKGYEINKVTAKDADGNKIDLKEKGDGKYTFTMPHSKVEIKATFKKAEETPVVAEEVKTILLTINQRVASVFGEPVVNDVAPVIRNDRTMLPIRFVAEALGATVVWDGVQNKVTITKSDLVIEIFMGSPYALVNGAPVELDAPAFIENSRTYLPLRFVAENLGATVTWNGETQEVTIVPNK